CRHCGKRALDHPSMIQGGGRTLDTWDDAVPDLELNRTPASQAHARAVSTPAAPEAVPRREIVGSVPDVQVGGGQVFDEDDAFGPAPGAPISLELDVQPGSRVPARSGALAPEGPPPARPAKIGGNAMTTPEPPPAGAPAPVAPVAVAAVERSNEGDAAI